MSVSYCVAKKNVEDELVVSNKLIDSTELYCMFGPNSSELVLKINSAIDELKHNGKIENLLNKYKAAIK